MSVCKSFFVAFLFLLCALSSHAATTLHTVQGDEITLASLKGKWVFINYWASWCQPCLDEIPVLNRFYESNKAGNVVVFAVNYDARPQAKLLREIKKFNIQYPSLRRADVRALHLGDTSVVPITFVINPEGMLSTTLYGGQTLKGLREAMSSSAMEPR